MQLQQSQAIIRGTFQKRNITSFCLWCGLEGFLRDIWKRFTHKILNHLSDRILFPALCPSCQPQKKKVGGCSFICAPSLSYRNTKSKYHVACFRLSRDRRRPLLPLITSAHTHLCDDEPPCHPGQSSELSPGSPRSEGISCAFFPPPALKLPLLELLSCPNRYNLRRLPVLGWDGPYLSRALRIKSYPTMHPVTRDAGLAR